MGGKREGNLAGSRYNALMIGRDPEIRPLAQPLTPREQEVLMLVGDQLSNRAIADELVLALSTVKWYVRQIFNKLGVDSREEAVGRARRLGLLSDPDLENVVPNNLPAQPTPFVGREAELAALDELVADSDIRIITILGPGGIGKTRLALASAERQLARRFATSDQQPDPAFPDGVFFVRLASVAEMDRLAPALADAIDFPLEGAGRDLRSSDRQLLGYLARKRMLLVLDNFEHLLAAGALVSEIVRRAPEVQLLITSRERLNLQGEQRFPIQGLKIPEAVHLGTASFATYASVQLFANTARRVDPDFVMADEEVSQLARICRLVGGMPLGLELAASWIGMLPIAEIAAELEESLHLLAADVRDSPHRHQSMQATLATSWRRLGKEQKEAFRRLSVFRGGFTRSAALDVAGANLFLLVALTNKSWLTYQREGDRYQIHELLRQYGKNELSANAEEETEVWGRHSAHFCAFLEAREEEWFGPRQERIVSEIRMEEDNIHAAWLWAVRNSNIELIDQGLDSLCRFYGWEGRWAEALTACGEAVESLQEAKYQGSTSKAASYLLRAKLLIWESVFTSKVERREALLEKSQDLLEQAASEGQRDHTTQVTMMMEKGLVALERDYEAAREIFQGVMPQVRELGNPNKEAEAQWYLGNALLFLGDYEGAGRLMRKSLKIYQQMGNTVQSAELYSELGRLAKHQGRLDKAEKYHAQSLQLFSELGNKRNELSMAGTLAYTQCWAGKFTKAFDSARFGVSLSRQLGFLHYAYPLGALAKAAMHLGFYEEASTCAMEGREFAQEAGDLQNVGWSLLWLGGIALVKEDGIRASELLQDSTETLRKIGHVLHLVPMAIHAYASYFEDDRAGARRTLAEILQTAIEVRSYFPVLNGLPVAALLAAGRGDVERAVELHALAWSNDYVANSRWFADLAGRELERLTAGLLPERVSEARSRGRSLDLWTTADELLREYAR